MKYIVGVILAMFVVFVFCAIFNTGVYTARFLQRTQDVSCITATVEIYRLYSDVETINDWPVGEITVSPDGTLESADLLDISGGQSCIALDEDEVSVKFKTFGYPNFNPTDEIIFGEVTLFRKYRLNIYSSDYDAIALLDVDGTPLLMCRTPDALALCIRMAVKEMFPALPTQDKQEDREDL